MKRREFINKAGIGIAGTAVSLDSYGAVANSINKNKKMKAQDVQDYLRSLCPINEPSVDRIIIGSAETEVKKIATAWMPYWDTLKRGVEQGYNLFVVHEPTFYTHWDLDNKNGDYYNAPPAGKAAYLKQVEEKKAWIEENKIVIIRSHDVPDKVAEWGIPFSLGSVLGFQNSDIIRSKTYYNVYEVEEKPAIEVAKNIAEKLKALGQPGVSFYGDPRRPVSSVGVGTGYICDPMQHADMEPDLFIAINDTLNTWTHCTYAEDSGQPLVVIDHGTSEDEGMRFVSSKLKEAFGDIEIQHFQQGCSFQWVSV